MTIWPHLMSAWKIDDHLGIYLHSIHVLSHIAYLCLCSSSLGLMSRLDVNGQVKHMQNPLVNYPPHEDYSYTRTNDGVELISPREVHHNQQQQQAEEGSYPSPASTISPHSRDLAMSISTSSELAFALESKPTDQVFFFSLYHISPVLIEMFLVNRHLEVHRNLIRHMVTIIRISSLLVLKLPFRTQMSTV